MLVSSLRRKYTQSGLQILEFLTHHLQQPQFPFHPLPTPWVLEGDKCFKNRFRQRNTLLAWAFTSNFSVVTRFVRLKIHFVQHRQASLTQTRSFFL